MKVKLADHPTFEKEWDRKDTERKSKQLLKKIGKLQNKMYAQNKYSILIVLQGMDASGKDGVTKSLLKYTNPLGIKIYSFKKPSETEYAHDFLWRVHDVVPRKGELHVFIRSHYEDILVPSVEKYIPDEIIQKRYAMINDFENLLEQNDTKVLKFFLNVSKETQKGRLMERIDLKQKHWKHKDGDWDTREKFDQYLDVYEKIINKCTVTPWYIVPSDKNWQKLYFIADVLLKALESLDLKWPELVTEKFREQI
jgi:PPK2 family polyphosphate:nucleotide phosphotransferase